MGKPAPQGSHAVSGRKDFGWSVGLDAPIAQPVTWRANRRAIDRIVCRVQLQR
jgi:hypothetical protein